MNLLKLPSAWKDFSLRLGDPNEIRRHAGRDTFFHLLLNTIPKGRAVKCLHEVEISVLLEIKELGDLARSMKTIQKAPHKSKGEITGNPETVIPEKRQMKVHLGGFWDIPVNA